MTPTFKIDTSSTMRAPQEVLSNTGISIDEKRTILASWASDARAVPNAPALRVLDDGSIVQLDAILSALKSLSEKRTAHDAGRAATFRRPPSSRLRRWAHGFRTPKRGDDDPPPCAPFAAIRPSRGGGGAAVAFADLAVV